MVQTDTFHSYLTFRLGDEIFAANVGSVLEILEMPRVTSIPCSPEYMRGVMNLRGNVLPLIEIRSKFGLPSVPDTIHTCVIVMRVIIDGQHITIGTITDAVLEVLDIDPAGFQPAPSIGARYKTEFIEGMVKADEQFIMVLNLDRVFSTTEATILQDIISAGDEQQAAAASTEPETNS